MKQAITLATAMPSEEQVDQSYSKQKRESGGRRILTITRHDSLGAKMARILLQSIGIPLSFIKSYNGNERRKGGNESPA